MKKILTVISAVSLTAILLFGVVNAQTSTQDVKKTSTEKKMDCGKCSSASKTCDMKTCDPSKCKEGKCDTAKCKANCTNMKAQMKKCDPSKCGGMGGK